MGGGGVHCVADAALATVILYEIITVRCRCIAVSPLYPFDAFDTPKSNSLGTPRPVSFEHTGQLVFVSSRVEGRPHHFCSHAFLGFFEAVRDTPALAPSENAKTGYVGLLKL